MKTYTIKSNFEFGEQVCMIGDNSESFSVGVVIGFKVSKANSFVCVAFMGNEPIDLFEEQIESVDDRKTRNLIGAN